jgi:hypothetical protein
MKVEVEIYRNLLQKYTLKGARDYLKLARRLEKEKKNYEFLVEKMRETDNDLVQAIADYMPLGIGLQLQNGITGFFLGDVKYGDRDNKSGFGVITRSNQLLVVKKEHVSAFAEAEDSIPSKQARDLLDLFLIITEWDEKYMESSVKPLLEASIPNKVLENDPKIASAIHSVQISKPFPNQKLPGSIIKQDLVLKELEAEMAASKNGMRRIQAGLKNNEIDQELIQSGTEHLSSPANTANKKHSTTPSTGRKSVATVSPSTRASLFSPTAAAAGASGGTGADALNPPIVIPNGARISDLVYTGAIDSTPPVVKTMDIYEIVRYLGRGAFGRVLLAEAKIEKKSQGKTGGR